MKRMKKENKIKKYRIRKSILVVLLYIGFAGFVFWILFPFVWVFISSFMNQGELGAIPPHWIPHQPTLDNYSSVILGKASAQLVHGTTEKTKVILPTMFRSFYISFIVSLVNIFIGGLAAYSISRFKTRFNNGLYLTFLISRVLPPMGMIIPFFIIFRRLNLINTPWALIISYNLLILPLVIWLLKGYFDSVPIDVEESALVDGANRFQTFTKILLPVAIPGFVATFIMSFMECWSEFFFALTLTDEMTLPPVLAGFQNMEQINWTTLAAATVLTLIIPITLALVLQKYIISGLTAGAIKG